jgi:hypothetical protein
MIRLMILSFLFPTLIFCQDKPMENLINDYCVRLEKNEVKDRTPEEVSFILTNTLREIQQENQEIINEITTNIQLQHPEYTQNDIIIDFSMELTESMIDNCKKHIELVRSIEPCPKENETLKAIMVEVDKLIELNSSSSFSKQMEIFESKLYDFVLENKALAEKDYENGIANPKLVNEINRYLINKSDRYLKVFLMHQAMRQLGI